MILQGEGVLVGVGAGRLTFQWADSGFEAPAATCAELAISLHADDGRMQLLFRLHTAGATESGHVLVRVVVAAEFELEVREFAERCAREYGVARVRVALPPPPPPPPPRIPADSAEWTISPVAPLTEALFTEVLRRSARRVP
ncbi:hypothetical protein [Streptomyces sp. SBT349]|uniref:hypothetical protein n=1 Tax=Streptomyces sp. SBT349 TaxID=1580539 RepID=UPI00066E6817|nr:hypothetical protein [Streptomyces sp. SBT349]